MILRYRGSYELPLRLSSSLLRILHPSIFMDRQRVLFDDALELDDEFLRIIVEDHIGRDFSLAETFDDERNRIADASGIRDNTDRTTFVVGDREFIQGADAAADDDDGVAASDVDDVSLHESHPREDDDVIIGGRKILVDVLVLRKCRRNADRHTAVCLRRKQRLMWQARTCTVDANVPTLGDFRSELFRLLTCNTIFGLRTACRAHHAYLQFASVFHSVEKVYAGKSIP